MTNTPVNDDNRRLVRLIAGDNIYLQLLNQLPDAFFRLSPEEEVKAWGRIYHAVTRGEKSPEKLIRLVC